MRAKAAVWCPLAVVCLGIAMAVAVAGRAADEDDDVAEHFGLMDRNDNDQLSPGEFQDAREVAQEVLAVDFESADKDKNGTLSLEEYHAYLSSSATASSGEGYSEGSLDEDALQALADILTSSASSQLETAEIEQLIEDLAEAGETDVITYVLSRPTAYPYAYRTLGTWAKRYPGRLTWANKIRAHNAAPKRSRKPAAAGSTPRPKPKPQSPPRSTRPSASPRPSLPARSSGRPSRPSRR